VSTVPSFPVPANKDRKPLPPAPCFRVMSDDEFRRWKHEQAALIDHLTPTTHPDVQLKEGGQP
jgi:hypothetical protein